MADTLRLGPDARINQILSLLRDADLEGTLSDDVQVSPGIHLRADPALGIAGAWSSPEGRLLEIEADMASPGAWAGLHVELGPQDLSPHGLVGFACRSVSTEMHLVRACLRSGTDEGFRDTFFDKHVLVHEEEASHIDALSIHRQPDLPLRAPWREIVLFLPTQTFTLTLTDLRVFIV